jgi:hypothetical protein
MFLSKQAVLRLAFLTSLLGIALTDSANAATFNIGSMNITNGTYTVWDSNNVLLVNPSTGSSISPITYFGPNTNLVSGYIGNGGGGIPSSTSDPASIFGGIWFGSPFNTYTAASNLGDDSSPSGSIVGGPVPTGTLDDISGTITMNLSSLFGNWGNVDFNVGTGKSTGFSTWFAVGNWDPLTGDYSMSWGSNVDSTVGGPCFPSSCTVQFTLGGTVTPVPVPASFWLLGSGLMSLLALGRRKRTFTST